MRETSIGDPVVLAVKKSFPFTVRIKPVRSMIKKFGGQINGMELRME
jgi:hypothetical protein